MRGLGWLIFGLIFIAGGLSGEYALRGTGSAMALWIVGIVFVMIYVLGLITRAMQPRGDAGRLGTLGQSRPDLDKYWHQEVARYSKAIELNPDDAWAYSNRGIAHVARGDVQQAIADYDKAIQLAPDRAHFYCLRAGSYERLGRHRRAIADYDRALELNPDDGQTYIDRGFAHDRLGDVEEAIADLEKAVSLDHPFAQIIGPRIEELKRQ